MKIAGKYNIPTENINVELTTTDGHMTTSGVIQTSSSYMYTQKVSVVEGDKVEFKTNPSSSGTIVGLTAFNEDTAVPESGISSSQVLDYTVPKNITYIVLTISSALKSRSLYAYITRNNAVAKGVSVNSDGKIVSVAEREWKQDAMIVLENSSIRDTNAITAKPSSNDVSSFAYVSLRIINSLDADISVKFYDDFHVTGGSVLEDINGNAIEINVPAKTNATHNMIVTPDDIPALNLLHYLTLRVAAKTVPTSGTLSIYAYGRK